MIMGKMVFDDMPWSTIIQFDDKRCFDILLCHSVLFFFKLFLCGLIIFVYGFVWMDYGQPELRRNPCISFHPRSFPLRRLLGHLDGARLAKVPAQSALAHIGKKSLHGDMKLYSCVTLTALHSTFFPFIDKVNSTASFPRHVRDDVPPPVRA